MGISTRRDYWDKNIDVQRDYCPSNMPDGYEQAIARWCAPNEDPTKKDQLNFFGSLPLLLQHEENGEGQLARYTATAQDFTFAYLAKIVPHSWLNNNQGVFTGSLWSFTQGRDRVSVPELDGKVRKGMQLPRGTIYANKWTHRDEGELKAWWDREYKISPDM